MPSVIPFLHCSRIVSNLNFSRRSISIRRRKRWALCIAHSFEAAVAKGYVFDFGRVVRLNAHGCAPPSTDLRIPPEYNELFSNILKLIFFVTRSAAVRAVFVRGSIVTGNFFLDGSSDLDLIIFTEREVSQTTKAELNKQIENTFQKHFQVSSVDVFYERGRPLKFGKAQFNISPSLCTILRHYAVPIYGTQTDVNVPMCWLTPSLEIGKDIREEERRFQLAIEGVYNQLDFNLQRVALQWMCKRCLRAMADLCCHQTLVHSRDLVPCFHAVSAQFPQFEKTFLTILQIACASERNNYLKLSLNGFLRTGLQAVRDAVEIVEDMYLKRYFPKSQDNHTNSSLSNHLNQRPKFLQEFVTDGMMAKIAFSRHLLESFRKKGKKELIGPFVTAKLPSLALSPNILALSNLEDRYDCVEEHNDLTALLTHVSKPTLVRKTALFGQDEISSRSRILEDLMALYINVGCRISPSNVVTFCRSEHPFLTDGSFTPPSVLRHLNPWEALHRMSVGSKLCPLMYESCEREHIYIQTQVRHCRRLFSKARDTVRTAQDERLWISTDGTVSSLHYDASYSALFQRTGRKHMILFPKEALYSLGVYPLGHPLHRRARVSLSHSDSTLFKNFWENWADKAVDVWIEPGELLLFPPFWAHYTESISNNDQELCCSHTFRYW